MSTHHSRNFASFSFGVGGARGGAQGNIDRTTDTKPIGKASNLTHIVNLEKSGVYSYHEIAMKTVLAEKKRKQQV